MKNPGGCCALYIRDNVIFNENPELIPQALEGICGTVTLPNKSKLLVVNIDRPPKVLINWFDQMNSLDENFSTTNKHFVFMCETNYLTQLVDKPTRITPDSKTLIDMIMTITPDTIVDHDL